MKRPGVITVLALLALLSLAASSGADCLYECRHPNVQDADCYYYLACPNPPAGRGGQCGNMVDCNVVVNCYLGPYDCDFYTSECVGSQCYVT